jgi:hypothetical protein
MENYSKYGMKFTPLRLTAHLAKCNGTNPAMKAKKGMVKSPTMRTPGYVMTRERKIEATHILESGINAQLKK